MTNVMTNNVHNYDGSLKESYKKLVELDNKYFKNNFEYQQCLDEIISENKECIDIINQIKTSPESNYDPINEIDFTDILPRVWKFYKYIQISNNKCVFFEQIIDIKTGLCSQGRTTRMFQLYKIWIDELERYIKNFDSIDKDIRQIFEQLKI